MYSSAFLRMARYATGYDTSGVKQASTTSFGYKGLRQQRHAFLEINLKLAYCMHLRRDFLGMGNLLKLY